MIHTKVARIFDPTQIVLAAGAMDGVTEGMEFIIYDLSDPILDPETKESLGQIELVKGRLIAEHVQDKITVARTPSRRVEEVVDPLAILTAGITPMWNRKYTVKRNVHDQLKVEGAIAARTDPVVRVGDRVRSVSDDMSIPKIRSA